MSTAPSGWQNPKMNWGSPDVPLPPDFNRIESNINAIEQGARTLDPSQAPTGNQGTLRQILSWFANRIKAILGTTNWYDSPPTTLTAAKSHIDAAAPHSGHETPSGAQAKVDAHAAITAAHGATSTATANRIIIRDANGRAKVAAPAAADDIARKDTVDAKFHETTGHKHTGAAGDGPKIPLSSIEGNAVSISSLAGLVWKPGGRLPVDVISKVYDMAYSPSLDRIVVVGLNGKIFTSDDRGQGWVERYSGVSNALYGVAWSPTLGMFVAVGDGERILSSPDGITWTSRRSGTIPLRAVKWFKDKFVVVGGSASATICLTSTNGTSWTQRTIASDSGQLERLVENGAYVFASNYDGITYRSADGISWSQISSNRSLRGSYGELVYFFSDNRVYVSSDSGQTIRVLTDSGNDSRMFDRVIDSPIGALAFGTRSATGFSTRTCCFSIDGYSWIQVGDEIGEVGVWAGDRFVTVQNNWCAYSPPW